MKIKVKSESECYKIYGGYGRYGNSTDSLGNLVHHYENLFGMEFDVESIFMRFEGGSHYPIIKVRQPIYSRGFFTGNIGFYIDIRFVLNEQVNELLEEFKVDIEVCGFNKKDFQVKEINEEMTVAEVCKALGKEVKIIK